MWPNPQETAALVPFTEEILNGKFHFLSSVWQISVSLRHLLKGLDLSTFASVVFQDVGAISEFLILLLEYRGINVCK